jgi:hypothetical protein
VPAEASVEAPAPPLDKLDERPTPPVAAPPAPVVEAPANEPRLDKLDEQTQPEAASPVETVAPTVEPDEPTVEVARADELEGPIATMAAAVDEATVALDDPEKSRRIELPKAATVPESRRDQVHARLEQVKQSKAEKAATKAAKRTSRKRTQPADALVARIPGVKPVYAAMLTGLVSGLICVLLAKGASVGCEAIRGNDSCNGGMGLLALVAILAIEVLIGANLLKAFKVSDPVSTSFLGVGLVAMITMLFFLDDGNESAPISSPKMIAIIPLITAVTFLLSWWVTVRFVEEE